MKPTPQSPPGGRRGAGARPLTFSAAAAAAAAAALTAFIVSAGDAGPGAAAAGTEGPGGTRAELDRLRSAAESEATHAAGCRLMDAALQHHAAGALQPESAQPEDRDLVVDAAAAAGRLMTEGGGCPPGP